MRNVPRLIKWILLSSLFFFLVMFLMRVVTFYVFSNDGSSLFQNLQSFWLGFRFDARVICIVMLLLLLLGSIPFLHPFRSERTKNGWIFFIGFFAFVLIVFYVFDFLHFKYLSQRLNASALSFLDDAKISGSMVWQTYPVVRILLGMLVAVILFVWMIKWLYKKADRSVSVTAKKPRIIWFVVVLLICALGIFGRAGQYPLRWSDAFNMGSDFKANLALNPIQSFFSSLRFRSTGFDEAKVKQYYPLVADYLGVAKPDSSKLVFDRIKIATGDTAQPKPNVILVICESFSAYKSSMWGNPLNTTPFFAGLCKQGVFFDNCFTPHFGTARGVWATITGIPDVEVVKTASRNPAMVDQHTIINDFKGYEKYYFLGGSTSWANIRGLLTNNIKNLHLYEQDDFEAPKIDVWGISDKNLFLESSKILGKEKQPFFAIIQTADNHRPYTIPEDDLNEFKKVSFPSDSLRKYGFESNEELNAFRYTDFGYQKFIESAGKQPYFDNTIFVFIGDHGINGNAGNMFPQAWTADGLTAFHVPLLFYSPKRISAQRYHCVASQVDVLPTIAGLANISYRNSTLGRDLLSQVLIDSCRSNIAFTMDHNNKDIGVVNRQWYYTTNAGGKQEKMSWADFSFPQNDLTRDSLLQHHRMMTTALYETARYLLRHNKK